MKTIIVNGIVVTMDPQGHVYDRGYVAFEDGTILEAGPIGGPAQRLQRTPISWTPEGGS